MIQLHQRSNGEAFFIEPATIVEAGTFQRDGEDVHYICRQDWGSDLCEVIEEPIAIAYLKKQWRDCLAAEVSGDSALYAIALSPPDDEGRVGVLTYGPAEAA
ncbi:hypothetical protein KIKIMORA_04240 [Brevundimonas phage vB_BpoS-Kikimora]|uniref:Uncharacterized protein n=1 Tax=Brevundimonas phage vB_BpoS-Kikimora TaxID=2948601 RepID=A0A9E7MT15_9CAUD|nr:hypothetical protein KIKIMORA_04240 [Brevundimonas phage vB_BpoS-Kikimora]